MGPFKSPGHGAKKQPATVTVITSIPKHCSVEDQIRLLLFDVFFCCYIKGHGWKFNFIGSSNEWPILFCEYFCITYKIILFGAGGNYNIIFNIIILFNSKAQQLRRTVLLARENRVVWRPHQIFACARKSLDHCQRSLRVCSFTEWSGQACIATIPIPNFEHKCTRGPIFI